MTITPARKRRAQLAAIILGVAAATAGLTALLINIFERKAEARTPYVRVVEVGEDDTDPARWGKNWPAEYDGYQRTAARTATRFGGHGERAGLGPRRDDPPMTAIQPRSDLR